MKKELLSALREIIFNPERSRSAEACFKVLSRELKRGEIHASNWRKLSSKDARTALAILKREFP